MSVSQIIAEINGAIGAHGAWKLRLDRAISTGRFDATAEHVACDDQCKFGKWIHGPSLSSDVREGLPYKVIRRLHADFHQCASRVVALATNDKGDEARVLLDGEYEQQSGKLMRALAKWKDELGQSPAQG